MTDRETIEREIREKLVARRRAREDLLSFIQYTYPNWETGEHHRVFCRSLQDVAEGRCRRLMIFAPPRHGKTECASRRFPAWFLGRWPRRQIICASYGDQLAHDIGRDVRDIIRDPDLYRAVFPKVRLRADTSAAGRWHTEVYNGSLERWETSGVYVSAGVGSGVTGYGADVFVIDDPIKGRAQADSVRQRELVWQWYMGVAQTRLMPGGSVIICNTRWHEDDLCGRLLKIQGREEEGGEWRVLHLPAIANEHTEDEKALWPGWWPLPDLRKIRDSMQTGGRLREWSAQYQGVPTPEEGDYIKRSWFENRYELIPSGCHIYMASDFAITGDRGKYPDYTEHGVFARAPDGRIYVVDWWYGQATADVWIAALLDLAKRWKPLCWFGEAGPIRRAIESFLSAEMRRERVFFLTEWTTSSSDKAARGRALQAMAQSGRIVFPETAPWVEHVLDHCVSFPTGVHDDAFDAMATICRVVDELHPAIAEQKVVEEPDRRGDYQPFGSFEAAAWKTV